MIKLGFTAFLTLALVACQPKPHQALPTETPENFQGILNGTEIKSHDLPAQSVVRILFEDKNKKGFACTGTLVERRFIVTAAHCLVEEDRTAFQNIRVVFPYSRINNNPIQVMTFLTHPLYHQTESYSFDIGLALLAQDAPADSVNADIADSLPNLEKTEFFSAGYGRTEKGAADGKLRWTRVKVSSESEAREYQSQGFINEAKILNSKEALRIVIDQSAPKSGAICHGDSGGPMFFIRNSRLVLTAVHSTVSSSECRGRAVTTSVPYLRRFFSQSFHMLRKIGNLENKVSIPLWEDKEKISSDSENIEIKRPQTYFPISFVMNNRPFTFTKARLVSAQQNHLKTLKGAFGELQFSVDSNFNCSTNLLLSSAGASMSIPLAKEGKWQHIEGLVYFLNYQNGVFERGRLRSFVHEITNTNVAINFMVPGNFLIPVQAPLTTCY